MLVYARRTRARSAVRRRPAGSTRAEKTTNRCRTPRRSGPRHRKACRKTSASASPGWYGHPPVGARRVEVHVRAEIGEEQRLAKQSRAEVRNDERHVWKIGGEGVQVERIAEAHVKAAGQPEFLSHADRQRAAVHEHGRARVLSRRARRSPVTRGIVQRIALHGREQTNAAEPEPLERVFGARRRVGAVGSSMKNPTNREGCRATAFATDASSPRDAGDQRRAADTRAIELLHPPVGEIVGRARRVPAKRRRRFGGDCCDPGGRCRPSVSKNCSEKKWT